RADLVLVVVVQQVQRTRLQLVHLTGLLVEDLALTLDDAHRLDVVGVPEVVDRTRVERGLVHRQTALLLGEHDALAAPVRGFDVGVGVLDVREVADDHCVPPLPGGRGSNRGRVLFGSAHASTERTESRKMSRPFSRSSSEIVNGGMILTTSLSGPEVSTISLRSKAALETLPATVVSSNPMPRARPRPLAIAPP